MKETTTTNTLTPLVDAYKQMRLEMNILTVKLKEMKAQGVEDTGPLRQVLDILIRAHCMMEMDVSRLKAQWPEDEWSRIDRALS